MTHTTGPRRAARAAAGTAALTLGATVLGGLPLAHATDASQSEPAGTAGARTSGWIAHELPDVYDTFGLGVDFYNALRTLGGHVDERQTAIDEMESRVDDYTKDEANAGRTAKLTLAVVSAGRDLTTYAGGKLDGALEQLVVASGPEGGRAKDSGASNSTNTVGQAFAVRALANLDSARLQDATSFLLQQQCSGGYFREDMDSADFTCDGGTPEESAPNVDATGHAVAALVVARTSGVNGLDPAIEKAADWLETQQASNGSFQAFGSPNSNTTGLATLALRSAGHRGTAGNAAAWVRRRQVDPAMIDRFPKLAGESGAIAYSDADLSAAKQDGITADSRISWWFAAPDSAQALPSLLPGKTLDVAAADHVKRAATVKVTVRGLVPGELWSVRRGATQVRKGSVPASGVVVTTVTMPDARRTVTLTAFGSRLGRTGAEKVAVG